MEVLRGFGDALAGHGLGKFRAFRLFCLMSGPEGCELGVAKTSRRFGDVSGLGLRAVLTRGKSLPPPPPPPPATP